MKKKLEADLISIAHRILKLKGQEDVNKLYAEVSELYEKLTVLKFAQENFEDDMPTIGSGTSFFDTIEKTFNNTVSDAVEVENQVYVNLDDTEDDEIFEPVMEKIKDMVAQMPNETHAIDALVDSVIPVATDLENELENLVADFQEIPVFEPVVDLNNIQTDESKKTLHDRLKKSKFSIGLNDKLAFVTHLFDGKIEDYERALSELNTLNSFKLAYDFIQNKVKPEHNNWVDKSDIENRFMEIIETKFGS